ncbi:MAG: DUF1800 family protein [Betaproteobacteria bacterium]|nr:DUF1800 family protein [Betaproteobacteria bacterium]
MRAVQRFAWAGAVALTLLLSACGGGKSSSSGNPVAAGPDPTGLAKPSAPEAARFLTQATFGPTQSSIDVLTQSGYGPWFADQFAKPQQLHRAYLDQITTQLAASMQAPSQNQFFESFWKQALSGDDALRQRVAFALSEIFVVSFVNGTVAQSPRGVASYYDVLAKNAFGNYRQLLEDVSLHPMMGIYLSSMRNQKENPAAGRVPDQNYAREVMQLFSIGLYELNLDGTPKLGANGKPIETYTQDDIAGLAKVFTGFSWYAGPALADRTDTRFFGGNANLDRDWQPMQGYAKYHSTSEKKFLGTTIPAQATADPEGDLKIALDRLYNHPNVGPFIGKQLIQRLVTSNPSPAYVSRVASVFNNNGSGVRGDLKAVVQAVLLDPEAHTPPPAGDTSFGKLREPVVSLANFLRAFNGKSDSGRYMIGSLDDPSTQLSQTPMRSPTVFNFFRPGYVPPNSPLATAGLVAPEMQLSNEASVAGYTNYMQNAVASGVGNSVNNLRDVRPDYSAELALADKPDALMDRINLLLTYGAMSTTLKTQIRDAVNSVAIPTPTANNANQAQIDAAKRNRVQLAVLLTLASPEYLAQK